MLIPTKTSKLLLWKLAYKLFRDEMMKCRIENTPDGFTPDSPPSGTPAVASWLAGCRGGPTAHLLGTWGGWELARPCGRLLCHSDSAGVRTLRTTFGVAAGWRVVRHQCEHSDHSSRLCWVPRERFVLSDI